MIVQDAIDVPSTLLATTDAFVAVRESPVVQVSRTPG
jgi:hypothetical protein